MTHYYNVLSAIIIPYNEFNQLVLIIINGYVT